MWLCDSYVQKQFSVKSCVSNVFALCCCVSLNILDMSFRLMFVQVKGPQSNCLFQSANEEQTNKHASNYLQIPTGVAANLCLLLPYPLFCDANSNLIWVLKVLLWSFKQSFLEKFFEDVNIIYTSNYIWTFFFLQVWNVWKEIINLELFEVWAFKCCV